ncbi:MAG TPA: carbonic anhydrase [Pyrinomonadaceae bacterium]|nr:carbonic anhydrase [Acidobacteriota bacterium]HQZ95562.1 carbonic anhydrase [Pyrinomonadaceae bacterium]
MKKQTPRYLSTFLTVFALLLGVSFVASCSKADATTKKEKTKKVKEDPETETAETDDAETKKEADHESDEPTTEEVKADRKKIDSLKESAKTAEKNKTPRVETTTGKSPVKDSKAAADEIWAKLSAGNKRYMAGKHTVVNYAAARKALVKGQQPEVIVLGCADSRVPPEFVFDKNLGEIFVVRDAGNIPDKVTLGSIEYAVEHLHAKALLILGHESCGAVAAAVSGEKMPSSNLSAIVDTISPAFEGSKTCIIGEPSNLSCVELNVKQSSEDVISRSSILRKAVKEGHLAIIRAVYKLESGEVVRIN